MILKETYNTPLAAGQLWQSSWLDNGLSVGEVLASVSATSDQQGQISISQSDDIENPQLTLPAIGATSLAPGGLAVVQVPITHLFWQVNFQNGPTAQTVFEIVISASVSSDLAVLLEWQKARLAVERLNDPYSPLSGTFSAIGNL